MSWLSKATGVHFDIRKPGKAHIDAKQLGRAALVVGGSMFLPGVLGALKPLASKAAGFIPGASKIGGVIKAGGKFAANQVKTGGKFDASKLAALASAASALKGQHDARAAQSANAADNAAQREQLLGMATKRSDEQSEYRKAALESLKRLGNRKSIYGR